jgi:DNA-binding beta-propeller fold protein YncE
MRRLARAPLSIVLAVLASSAEAAPLTLSPVGVPIPGQAPVGIATRTFGRNTYVAIADYEGNQLRHTRLDKTTGTLSPVGAVPIPNKPSAVASAHKGPFLLVTTEDGDDVTSVRIDPATGLLTLVGSSVTSGGADPVNLDVDKRGHAVIANKASSTLGVVRIDPKTGLLSLVGAPIPVGAGPNDVKVKGKHVVVGTAVSNEVHLLRLDKRTGSLAPVDVKSVGASRVTGVTIKGNLVIAATFAGDVHAFEIGSKGLKPLGAHPSGGDITDVAFAPNGWLFVAGGLPGRLAAFTFHKKRGLEDASTLDLTPFTSRTIATVKGKKGATFVIENEFQGDQTIVVSAQR